MNTLREAMSLVPAAPPYLACYIGMGKHLAHIPGKEAQELILYGSQMHLLARKIGAACGIVYPELSVFKYGASCKSFRCQQPKAV